MYEYKMIPVAKNLAAPQGKDLGQTLADYIEKEVNKMAEAGWEFYRADNYSVSELLGCLGTLLGQTGNVESYNLLVFRREKQQ